MTVFSAFRAFFRPLDASDTPPKVLILTPCKDAAGCLASYCDRVRRLTYPHDRISLAFLESDSSDDTYAELNDHVRRLRKEFRRVTVCKRDFGFKVPVGVHRSAPAIQLGIMASDMGDSCWGMPNLEIRHGRW
jgi:hypothetical protein